MRKVYWITPILLSVFVHGIGDSNSARAESKTSSKKSTPPSAPLLPALLPHWNHNGSVVSLVSQGTKQKLFYDSPRVGLLDVGVKPGTLLFEGQRDASNITGTAYQFYRTCKSRGYDVSGSASDDRKTITLKGKAPMLDMNCNVTGSREDILVFTASQIAPSEPRKDAPVANAPAIKPVAPPPADIAETKKSATVATPSAPPEANRTPDKPVIVASAVPPAEPKTASNVAPVASPVAPSEPPKDKPVVTNPAPETVAPGTHTEVIKQPATTQTALNAASAPPSASAVAPPTPAHEPAKADQTATVSSAIPGSSKAPDTATPNTQSEKSTSTPPNVPPKDTQVAAIPANAAVKAEDASKSKVAAPAVAVAVTPPSVAPDKSKPDVSKPDTIKTPVSLENKTTPVTPTGGSEKMMEIVLKNGRILRIGRDIELEALSRIIAQLER